MEKRRSKKEILKIVLVIVLTILILAIIGLIYCTKQLVNSSKDCPKTNKVIEKRITTEQIKKQDNIVFLGDSITDYYPIDNIYVDLPIVKSGVAGYRTQDILDRMDTMVYQYNPTKVFLLIGTNDITEDKAKRKEKAVNNIKEIIENIKKNRKKAKIYLESIYPVNEDIDEEVVDGRENSIIQEMNEKLKTYCDENNITYIDMYKELENDEKKFDKKYTNDGLHPNDLGYAKISQVRVKYIYDIK